MDVSVITVNYKTSDFVIGAIKSLREKSSGFSYEVIVIDNASGDGSVDAIKSALPDVRIIESKENLGTSKAYNLGIRNSYGEYVFIMNPDVEFINNAIYEMLVFLRAHPDVAIVCGNLYDLDKNPTHSYLLEEFDLDYIRRGASLTHLLSLRLQKNKFLHQHNFTNKPIEVGYACAAAMLMRKKDTESIGNFDESIFMYGEEAVISHKLREIGLKTVSIPQPKIIHFEGGSFKTRKSDETSFNQRRYRRFIDGNYSTFEVLNGSGGGKDYLNILLRNEKKLSRLYRLLGKKNKYWISQEKIEVITEMIKEK